MRVNIPSHNTFVDFPDDMPEEKMTAVLMQHFPPRPTHDDLEGAAVTGENSLELQDMAPEVKPAVKMTLAQFTGSNIPPTKPFFSPGNGEVYVFAENAPDLESAIDSIISGDDSEILGYPNRKGVDYDEMTDMAVNRNGDIVTDLGQMKQESENGNILWAAEGNKNDLIDKATKVSDAIRRKRGMR